jgi:nicotinamidase-related amidase
MAVWDDLLSDTDREVIRRGGYGKPRGLGRRPVMMIVDPQYNYCGDDRPILEQLDRWPSGAGEAAWRALEKITRLLAAARRCRVPVVFTRQVQRYIRFDGFAAKAERDPSPYMEGAAGTRIVAALAPRPEDIVVDKSAASAFFGTPLLSYLIRLRVDTLIVTGGTTSGCVRALCVDAASRGFSVGVVADAVFDRIGVSHKVALLDLWMKTCDLCMTSEAETYLSAG